MNLVTIETLFSTSLEPHCSTAQRTHTLQLMRKNGSITPELGLLIYANNISGARIKSLAAACPACVRILGEACFNSIAQRFIEHTPSKQPDLNSYGETFSDFLDDWVQSHEQFSEYRYLGDLARLEWLCHTAYYAEDNPPFDFPALAEAGHASQEAFRFQLGHCVGLLQSDYPVMTVREINLSNSDAAAVQPGELPEQLVVSRPVAQPHVERVDETTFLVLVACREGKTLGQILDTGKQQARLITNVLPGLIERNWITGFTMGSAPGVP